MTAEPAPLPERKRPRKSVTLEGSQELRGHVVRLYPTQEQTRWLYRCQCELRSAWNLLVDQHQAHVRRCIERAVADGAIPALPARPPKEAPRKERNAWHRAHDHASIAASRHVRGIEGYGWPRLTMRADCYQPIMAHVKAELGRELECNISAFRAVLARFSASRVPKKGAAGWKPPRWKREAPPWLDTTMIQVRDGECLRREGGKDCTLVLFGERIAAHSGRPLPEGAPVGGCSVVRRADGWYAAIRTKEPARELPRATRGPVAVCLGLVDLLVTSDGRRWQNPRGNQYMKLVAYRDERAAELTEQGLDNEAWDLRQQNKRYMLHFARKTQALILQEILPALGEHDTIILGEMRREDVQGPRCRLDEDDEGGALSACGALRAAIRLRYRERVAEVAGPGVDDEAPDRASRYLLAKWAELQGS